MRSINIEGKYIVSIFEDLEQNLEGHIVISNSLEDAKCEGDYLATLDEEPHLVIYKVVQGILVPYMEGYIPEPEFQWKFVSTK